MSSKPRAKLLCIKGPIRLQRLSLADKRCPLCTIPGTRKQLEIRAAVFQPNLPRRSFAWQSDRNPFVPAQVLPPTENRQQRNFATKRATRPLSFAELVQRQKAQEARQEEQERARREFEQSIQRKQTPSYQRISAFRPEWGSPRYRRSIFKNRLGLDDSSYPFPESTGPVGGLRRRKRVYFRTGHRFLLARYLEARHKRLVVAEKAPKELEALAKKTALNITKQRYKEARQMEYDKSLVENWKEGDETFLLPITTADITKVTKNTVSIREFSQTSTSINLAAQVLREDCVVAFPTETVYGLGANALSSTAIQKIYRAKNRPSDNPLISHFGSIEQLEAFTQIPEHYLPLIETFWPGPLTLLLPVKPEMGISPLVTASLDTLAVRVPSNPLARALILKAGIPIAAPSANASTKPSPTLATHVQNDLNGRIPLILSADDDLEMHCEVGLESTVVDGLSNPPVILRLGGISPEQIRSLGGIWRNTVVYQPPKPAVNGLSEDDFKPRTPGMKYRHYSPTCPVHVFKAGSMQPESPSKYLPPSEAEGRKIAILCTRNWEPKPDPGAQVEFNWLGDDSEEVARNLFKCVREMDQWGAEVILVEGVEESGIGRSVMERLRKMAGGLVEE